MSILKFEAIPDSEEIDIAIIGAGISGVYCAYRLINSPQFEGKKIAIYERLNRVGGRLQSDVISIGEENGILTENKRFQVREEEGGMRVNFDMEEIMTLNARLGLCDQLIPFPMGSTGDTNRFCIRGHSFSLAEADAGGNMIWSQLYDLYPEEVGLSPGQIVTNAYLRIVEANDNVKPEKQTPEYWQNFRLNYKWKDTPMNEWQMWGLLGDMGYSEECIQMLSETIGFEGPFKSLTNAGDAWQILADFPEDPSYYTYKQGFSTLPNTIISELKGRVDIYLGTAVTSIEGTEDNFTLSLTEAPKGHSANLLVMTGERKAIKAKQIISAIASTGFKNLFVKSPALNVSVGQHNPQQLWESINGVLGLNLMKINFYFREAWWYDGITGRPNIEFGPNFTDLPINSIYPFYSEEDLAVKEGQGTVTIKTGKEPAALTLYCDFNNTNYWKGLQNVGPKFTSDLQQEYNNMVPQVIFAASQAVVAEARKQMGQLFGVTNIPEPVFTSYRLWNGEDDFEHAYHQWKMNVNDKDTIEYLSNPLPGFYICNEAISDMQGWVNGSLRSCNRALNKISKGSIQPLDNEPCKSKVTQKNPDTKVSLRIGRGYWG